VLHLPAKGPILLETIAMIALPDLLDSVDAGEVVDDELADRHDGVVVGGMKTWIVA
jgi:hypothetical protein